MKIIRYRNRTGQTELGAITDDGPPIRLEGDLYGALLPTEQPADIHKLLAPVVPSTIIGIGLNYRRHAEETGAAPPAHPVVFFKLPGCVQNPEDPIEIPQTLQSHKVDYECELAVVIGTTCQNATPENALSHVLGYTCANDVSARDWQKEGGGGQWCRGKMFRTFCPLGPCLVTPDEIADPGSLRLETRLNGKTVQSDSTRDMIFSVAELIVFLSASSVLLPGTVILTGTPPGVGMARTPPLWLKPGDRVEIEIEGIGLLANPVENEPL